MLIVCVCYVCGTQQHGPLVDAVCDFPKGLQRFEGFRYHRDAQRHNPAEVQELRRFGSWDGNDPLRKSSKRVAPAGRKPSRYRPVTMNCFGCVFRCVTCSLCGKEWTMSLFSVHDTPQCNVFKQQVALRGIMHSKKRHRPLFPTHEHVTHLKTQPKQFIVTGQYLDGLRPAGAPPFAALSKWIISIP
jgi:hypothetical protein